MRLGIVGSESAKFTPETEERARERIRLEIKYMSTVVSGGCHLGGIDIWAKEEATKLGIHFIEFLPRRREWAGYRDRNVLIAKASDKVICLTVKSLPPDYKVRGFEKFCYHCKTDEHIKSGGCWTVKFAKNLGKPGEVIVIC